MLETKVVNVSKYPLKLPKAGDAGLDLIYNGKDPILLFDTTFMTLETGIFVEIPEGYFGLIKPRSGLSAKYGIDVLAGVIDSSYRGEIKVVISKIRSVVMDPTLEIKPGDRIAQMVVIPCVNRFIVVDNLSETERGEKGFGSSGR